ncbi:lipoprotein [Streptomyces pharetrae]|uniref:lipoprotein n=1 Tax=Streptomyces pharetrae TaxID=291370 RepID=UPI0036511563
MQVRVGTAGRVVASAALGAMVLTGCSDTAEPDAKVSPTASAGASQDAAGGGRGGSIGAAGSACELPVTFDIAARWEAEAIDAAGAEAAADELKDDGAEGQEGLDKELAAEIAASLLRQGPVVAACEVDAKPAGNIGFLRVFTGEPGTDDARTVLEAFVTAEESDEVSIGKQDYRTFRSGDLTGVEVSYLRTSEILEETKQQHALAVTTADGPVVLHLGGLDDEEHKAMLPAFELAKRTLRVS